MCLGSLHLHSASKVMINYFFLLIEEIQSKFIPNVKKKVKGKDSPWLTDEIRKQIKLRKRALNKFTDHRRTNSDIATSNNLRKKYNIAKNRVINMISSAKKSFYADQFLEICDSPGVWRICDTLLGKKKCIAEPLKKLIIKGDEVSNKHLICDSLAASFE